MHLTKVSLFCNLATWEGRSFLRRCANFAGALLPTPHVRSTWRKVGGRMDLLVQTVGAGNAGLSRIHLGMSAANVVGVPRRRLAQRCIEVMWVFKSGFGRPIWSRHIHQGSAPNNLNVRLAAHTEPLGSCCTVCDMRWSVTHDPDWRGVLKPMKRS